MRRRSNLKETVDELLNEAGEGWLIQAHGMYRFFPAQSDGQRYSSFTIRKITAGCIKTFTFPRQQVEPYLCLADFLKSGGERRDGLCRLPGRHRRRRHSRAGRASGRKAAIILRSHALQSLALEVAEALPNAFIT